MHCECQWEPQDGLFVCRECGAVRNRPSRRICRASTLIDVSQTDLVERVKLCIRCKLFPCLARDECTHEKAMRRGSRCPRGMWGADSGARAIGVMSYFQPAFHKLNLIYHVCPLVNDDVWRANLRQITRRWHIWGAGRKVIAVAVGEGLCGLDEVQRELGKDDVEWLQIQNDPQLREVGTFLPLLEAIRSTDPWEATFYAHTKGNSTAGNRLGAQYWRNAMYHHLLDDINAIRHNLANSVAIGTHLMQWPETIKPPYPSKLQHGNWMFAGTFFWFRNKDVFEHPRWNEIPNDRYGAEAWLSGLFHPNQVTTMFQPWPADQYPSLDPYDPRLYVDPIADEPGDEVTGTRMETAQ